MRGSMSLGAGNGEDDHDADAMETASGGFELG
jgi:hypothetical protein